MRLRAPRDRATLACAEGRAPDFGIVRGILDYYLSYPDLYHRPKEDLIYHRLRALAPEQAESVKGLLVAHEELGQLTRRFASATVDQMLDGDEVPRAWFASLARKFIDTNRHHLVTQEERFHALHESILELERAGGKSRHAE